MTKQTALRLVKLVHNLIWLVMASACFYILYAGLTGILNFWLWLSIGLLLVESAVLIVNGWTCPLTSVAKRYTDERQHNFDIYLPEIVAKHNKLIFGTIFVVGLSLVLLNIIKTYA